MRPATTLLGLAFLLSSIPTRAESSSHPTEPSSAPVRQADLPPVPVEDLRPRVAPLPQWDLGISAGVCGVGRAQIWQETRFCGGAIGDVTFLRRREPNGALGLYGSLFTTNFVDGRYGLGGLGLLPLGDLIVAQAAVGPYLHSDGLGVSPGVEGNLSFGLRSLNQRGHYGHAHALVLGVAHTPGSDTRSGTTLSLTLRIDAFWLAMPFARIF